MFGKKRDSVYTLCRGCDRFYLKNPLGDVVKIYPRDISLDDVVHDIADLWLHDFCQLKINLYFS